MEERKYLKGGAKDITLPSGDKGFYIDFDYDFLVNTLNNLEEEYKRYWTKKFTGERNAKIRVFCRPKDGDDGFYKYYLEIVKEKE